MLNDFLKSVSERLERRATGCLPHNIGLSLNDLSERVGDMTAEDIKVLNELTSDDHQTMCAYPIVLIGKTKDGQIAYYGLNFIGALPLDKLEAMADVDLQDDKYGYRPGLKASLLVYKATEKLNR